LATAKWEIAMTTAPFDLRIAEIELACDTVECGYRIVRTEHGQHAFVWGNIRARIGDDLPREDAVRPTADRGIEVYESFDEATKAWRDCAVALQVCDQAAGQALLGVLP
jgi:hypothetical protein